MQKFLIEIPLGAYLRCLAKFEDGSEEYNILRNGIVLQDCSSDALVHLRCDADKAQLIQSILFRECPEFLDRVHYYPDLPPNF